MVVTPGRDRRAELRDRSAWRRRDRLVYFYVGRYGQADLGWERLGRLGERGHPFRRVPPGAERPLANLHVVPRPTWTGADLAARADAAVAKAGYGTVCEAMVAGTPLIYPPRARVRRAPRRSSGPSAPGAGGVPISSARLPGPPAGARPGTRPRRSGPARRLTRPTAPGADRWRSRGPLPETPRRGLEWTEALA